MTALQDFAFQVAEASELSRDSERMVEYVKALQVFVNPEFYKKVYLSGDDDSLVEVVDSTVDVSSPEEVDAYLQQMWLSQQEVSFG